LEKAALPMKLKASSGLALVDLASIAEKSM